MLALKTKRELQFRCRQRFHSSGCGSGRKLAALPTVKRIVLFGSVANPLVEEVPRFRYFRRWGIAVPHECKDVDLAVWMEDFSDLRTVQKAKLRGLNALLQEEGIGVAHHQVDIFLFDAATDCYTGRLCQFAVCPKGKPECRQEGCGQPPYLKSDPDFSLKPDALIPERSRELYVCEKWAKTITPLE